MLFRVTVIALGGGYLAYRVALAWQILQAKKAGDLARERHLRAHGFGLYRWAVGAFVIVMIVLTLLVWSNSR
ncbi:MAG: hypothetical protein QM747_05875 [Nocardioides sp.]